MKNAVNEKRVFLRSLRSTDSEAIYHWLIDKAISRTASGVPYPYTREIATKYIRRSHKARREKTDEILAIIECESDQLIGMVGIHVIAPKAKRAEIGYWLARPFWGKGLMTEVVDLALVIAFTSLKLHKLQAHVFDGNIASVRVLEKNGFTQEGYFRHHYKIRNRYRDSYYFGLLKEAWLAGRK